MRMNKVYFPIVIAVAVAVGCYWEVNSILQPKILF